MNPKRWNNVIAALGDSLTFMGPNYKFDDQNWVSVLEYGLAGYATSAVVAVSGNTITLAPGSGVFFQPGCRFLLTDAANPPPRNRDNRDEMGGAPYTVLGQSGDVLTVTPAPYAGTPAGEIVVGVGGGCNVVGLNCGHSGDTTAQMLARKSLMFRYGTPALALLLGGNNDGNPQGSSTIQASPSSTTSTLYVANGSVVNSAGMCAGLAWPGSHVMVGGVSCLVAAVTAGTSGAPDSITLAAPLASAPGSGTTVSVDTVATLAAIGKSLLSAGVQRLLVLGIPGNNWASGGDFPTASTTTAGMLAKQQAAATALGVPFCSIYAFMAARVTAGIDSGTSGTYQYVANNGHPSVYGDTVYAMAVAAGIAGQSGWLQGMA